MMLPCFYYAADKTYAAIIFFYVVYFFIPHATPRHAAHVVAQAFAAYARHASDYRYDAAFDGDAATRHAAAIDYATIFIAAYAPIIMLMPFCHDMMPRRLSAYLFTLIIISMPFTPFSSTAPCAGYAPALP